MKRVILISLVVMGMVTPCVSYARQNVPAVTENALAALEKANAHLDRFVLKNGIICLVKEDHSAPVVSMQIWVGTGSIHEHEYLGAGLSHAIEHMIFKGTEKRAPGDITREINDAGGNINAYTSLDRTVFHADLPARNWRVGLNVLADAVMHASFPDGEWKKEKQVILREIAMDRDDPDQVLSKLLWQTAYTVHPYRFPVIGYEDIFRSITRDDLITFFRRNYVSDNMIVSVVGDIIAKEVKTAIQDVFADFHRRPRPPIVLPSESPQISPRFSCETGAYNVSRLEWSYHTVPLSHPDTPTLDLLAQIAGQGRSSRLVHEVKEKQKLVHSISAWSYTPREPGLFGVSATFDPEKEDEVVTAIQKEIDSWLAHCFSWDEIDKAHRMVLSSELSNLQTMKGQANSYAAGEFYAGDPRFSETYLQQLGKVTPQILQGVAQKYLQPKNKTLVILSPLVQEKTLTDKGTSVIAADVKKVILPNELPLLVREDHRLPFVYFCAALGGGLLSENDSNNGITTLMSDLMARGTKTMSGDEIARTVESLGGAISGYSGYNSFGLQAKCFSSDAEIFMRILADCLLSSTFPVDEIVKQRSVQLAEIDQEHERPFFLAQKELRTILFPYHPYRWCPLGSKETVKAIQCKDLLAHFRKHVLSENLVVCVFGDITLSAAEKMAETYLGKIPKGQAGTAYSRPICSKAEPQLPSRTKRREPKEQSILLAGFPGVAIKDPRYDALTILQTAMSGLSSDLAIAVREKRGLAYYVGAYQQAGIEPGMFVFYAGTREDAVEEVEKLVTQEICRIVDQGIREEELNRARNQIIADYEMGLQDNSNLAMDCALNELYGLGYLHTFTTKQRFEAITSKDVQQAATSIISTNKLAISLVLPQKGEEK